MRLIVVSCITINGSRYLIWTVFASISATCTHRFCYFLLHTKGIDPLASTDPFGNYVSFTIWEEKKHFNAWRGGEAFKEVSCISPTAQYVDILLTSISSPCYSLPSLLLYITTEGSRWYFLICVRHNHGLKRPRPRGPPKTRLL
jgi:hypothetical protein